MPKRDRDLDAACEIHGPDDARRLYGNWAETCDDHFGEDWGYVAPREIARLFRAGMGPEDHPHKDDRGLVMVFRRL